MCGVHASELRRRLCVDHDKETGQVRGLLCDACNLGIGKLRHSVELLESGIRYLRQYDHVTG